MHFLITSLLTFSIPAALAAPALQPWFDSHPRVAKAMLWADTDPARSYGQWPAEKKQAFTAVFEKVWQWQENGAGQDNPLSINLIPENIAPWRDNPNSNGNWAVYISAKDAWDIYSSHAAQSLVYEMKHGKQAPLEDMSDLGLQILFNGTRMFYSSKKGTVFRFSTNQTGSVVPAPATLPYRFLKQNNLIGNTPQQTIEKLLEWSRQNLEHFSGDSSYANAQKIWQYPGFPPLARILQGTISEADPSKKRTHYTAGCSGTVGFLISVLRTVNIPVELKEVCPIMSHAAAHFVEQGLYMSHGDDPYNQFSRKQPRFAIGKLLYNRNQWEPWFEGEAQRACDQVGKTPEQVRNSSK